MRRFLLVLGALVATFELPVERLIERFGYSIGFRLTVTDDGSPAATDSDTVVLRINQPPVAHIEVTAKLLDRGDEEGYDDNGNGVVDENEERYTVEGVISRPGERGNDENVWKVGADTLLVIDGSGSFDPDGELADTSFTWELLRYRGAISVAHSLPIGAQGQSIVGQRMLSTDEDPLTAANSDTETVARLPILPGADDEPFFVYYRLTVTDEDGANARQIVKIEIENLPNPQRLRLLCRPQSGRCPPLSIRPPAPRRGGRHLLAALHPPRGHRAATGPRSSLRRAPPVQDRFRLRLRHLGHP